MIAPPSVDKPSPGVFLVLVLDLLLTLGVEGMLVFGPRRIPLVLSLSTAWLLFVILACSTRTRLELMRFIKRFWAAAKDFENRD